MELRFSDKGIEFEKTLNSLDKFVVGFTEILNKLSIKYVIVSGYVSIIFGRNRSSEDVDMILEKLDFERFCELWRTLAGEFECIITEDAREAYEEYLLTGHAIRFSIKREFIPNMELKFPKTALDHWSLANRIRVVMNKNELFISPLELQICFKLFLGSEKDIEDARYLYDIFKDRLDKGLLKDFSRNLKIDDLRHKYLR
jgi:hypothetical protein